MITHTTSKIIMIKFVSKKPRSTITPLAGRAYFRIQGKHLKCSRRAFYLCNTIWPNSPKLMKVLVTICWNRLSSLHIPLWHIALFTVSYFLSEILRISHNGKNTNLKIYYSFFSRETQRYHLWIVKSTEISFKEFCKNLLTLVEQRREFYFLEPLKRLFHHSVNRSLTQT